MGENICSLLPSKFQLGGGSKAARTLCSQRSSAYECAVIDAELEMVELQAVAEAAKVVRDAEATEATLQAEAMAAEAKRQAEAAAAEV